MWNASIRTPHSRRLDFTYPIVIHSEIIKLVFYNFLIILLIYTVETCSQLLQILFSYNTLCKQFFRIEFIGCRMVFYLLVHQRLGKGRLILFIMPMSSVTYNVNEDVFLELLAIGYCNFHAFIQDIRLVSIYMDYRGINSLCDLCAVER